MALARHVRAAGHEDLLRGVELERVGDAGAEQRVAELVAADARAGVEDGRHRVRGALVGVGGEGGEGLELGEGGKPAGDRESRLHTRYCAILTATGRTTLA